MSIQNRLFCLVMAGGKGTRFWPESTSEKPKQYLSLFSDKSLLHETLLRFDGLVDMNDRYIVTVKNQEKIARSSSLGSISDNGLIFEPSGRNTAPCILLALVHLLKSGANPDDVVAIVPADHVILNSKGFQETITKAKNLASKYNKIVTIGINPNFPHTGYGYIHKGDKTDDGFKVLEFKEKPDFETAKKYVESGKYYWNAGMFMGPISLMLSELEKHSPSIYKFKTELENNLNDFESLSKIYNEIPSDSIDYAVMEKSSEVFVVPAEFDWNDLGSWDALEAVCKKRNENILLTGDKGEFLENAKNNIVFAPNQHVSLINISDFIIVSNERALMIMPKKDNQKVKEIYNTLDDKLK